MPLAAPLLLVLALHAVPAAGAQPESVVERFALVAGASSGGMMSPFTWAKCGFWESARSTRATASFPDRIRERQDSFCFKV